jgi:dTDP-4-dehydrorhamnose reductase
MKVLILGSDGMIGHKIAHSLNDDCELILSSRKSISLDTIGVKRGKILLHDLITDNLDSMLKKIFPDLIINCAGITTRRGVKDNIQNTRLLNSDIPHKLDSWANLNSKKLIHFSTDCVFSGSRGNYLDNDISDANDTYGKTKAAGEVNSLNTLTIRCSMIGRELYNFTELFEWLVKNKNKNIDGYSKVFYSGITTVRMGKIISKIIKEDINLTGIYNISSIPITKFDLLHKLSNAFGLNVDITENKNIKSNKVLNSKKFTEITGIKTPDWDDLISEFVEDCGKNKSLYKN